MAALYDINNLYRASFRGVEFLWDSVQEKGGLKTAIHEFVNSNNRYVESLGVLNDVFTVSGVAAGPDYITILTRLKNAMRKEDEGVLFHPFEGEKNVYPLDYEIVQDDKALGIARIQMKFAEVPLPGQGNTTAPNASGVSVEAIQFQATSTKDAINNGAATNFVLDDPSNYKASENILQKISRNMNDVISRVNGVADKISSAQGAVDTFNNDLTRLLNTPNVLMTRTSGLFSSIKNLARTPKDRLDALSKMFSFGDTIEQTNEYGIIGTSTSVLTPLTQVNPNTRTAAQRQTNQNKLKSLMQATALVEAYEAASEIEYTTVGDVDSVTDLLAAQFNKLFTQLQTGGQNLETYVDLDSASQNSLLALRDLFRTFMDQARLAAFDVETIQVHEQTAQTIAYELYGSTENVNLLIPLNAVGNVADIDGAFEVLVSD